MKNEEKNYILRIYENRSRTSIHTEIKSIDELREEVKDIDVTNDRRNDYLIEGLGGLTFDQALAISPIIKEYTPNELYKGKHKEKIREILEQ